MTRCFSARVGVRWSDLDLNGHVNNARILTLIEEARIQWRAGLSNLHPMSRENPTVVASLGIDYLKPISAETDVVISISVTRIGTRSYSLAYQGQQDGEAVLTANTVMVPLEADGSGARLLATNERRELEPYLVPVPEESRNDSAPSFA